MMKQEIETRIVDQIFSNSEAYENLLVLADDIGIRLAGTSNEIKARDFLVETLWRYGLDNVHTQTFPHRAWSPIDERLLIQHLLRKRSHVGALDFHHPHLKMV
jgi:hypothetical protein